MPISKEGWFGLKVHRSKSASDTIFIKKPFGFFKKGGEPLPSYKIWYNIFSEEIHKFQKLKAKRWELEKIGIFLIK